MIENLFSKIKEVELGHMSGPGHFIKPTPVKSMGAYGRKHYSLLQLVGPLLQRGILSFPIPPFFPARL